MPSMCEPVGSTSSTVPPPSRKGKGKGPRNKDQSGQGVHKIRIRCTVEKTKVIYQNRKLPIVLSQQPAPASHGPEVGTAAHASSGALSPALTTFHFTCE